MPLFQLRNLFAYKRKSISTARALVKLVIVCVAFMLLVSVAIPQTANALGQLAVQEYRSIAPASIPASESEGEGTEHVGMAMMRFINSNTVISGYRSMSKITVELTGGYDTADIERIRVYFEGPAKNTLFDRGDDVNGDDVDPTVGGPYSFDSGTTEEIALDPDVVRFNDTDSVRIYVSYDFVDGADTSGVAGCEIVSVEWGPDGDGTGEIWTNPNPHGIARNVDDYAVTLDATGIAPTEAQQNAQRVGILSLEFKASDSSATANIDSIRLHRIGTGADSDIASGGVSLYDDSGSTSGQFDAGDQEIATGTLSGGYVTLNPAANLPVDSAGVFYHVAVNIAANAQIYKTVGLELENPANDVVCVDIENDPDVSVQYSQKGYISSSQTIPLSNNEVFIPAEMIVQDYRSIAPLSIPRGEIPGAGTGEVGMTLLRFAGTAGTQSVSSVTLQLTGSIDRSDIENVTVYFEAAGLNGSFDRGSGDDVEAVTGGPYSFDTGPTKTIHIDPNIVQFGTDSVRLWVSFDFSATADASAAAGCEITSVVYGPATDGTGNLWNNGSLHGLFRDVDDYEVTLAAFGHAPMEAQQSEEGVQLLELDFGVLDMGVTANIDSIRFHRVGSGADSDVAIGGVILYDDSGSSPGTFDEADQELATGSLSGGYVTLNPSTNVAITSAGATFFVALNIAPDAVVGHTVGLEIEDPSVDVVCADTETDSYVSVQYNQKGYITDSTSTPLVGNTVFIIELVIIDTDPPTISYTDPPDKDNSVSINTDIVVIFSENMDENSITLSSFVLRDSKNNAIPGTIVVSGSRATFSPATALVYEKSYTATVTTDVTDLAGNHLASEYSFGFTTVEYVPDPVAANNRILPGSNDPVKIYIPEPPAGAQDRITVQVFTITGERVATLVNNRPYSQISGSLPLLWYGKNGRNMRLGPGLYFIQIRATNYKRVLKVLIVR